MTLITQSSIEMHAPQTNTLIKSIHLPAVKFYDSHTVEPYFLKA